LKCDEQTKGSLDVADDREPDTERTTIVTTDGGDRGSSWIVLLLAVIAILLAVLFFTGVFDRGDDDDELNVDVNTPDMNAMMLPPETQTPVIVVPGAQVPAPPPDINVNVTAPPPEPPADNLSNESNVTNSG
jgi:hypothetical protein